VILWLHNHWAMTQILNGQVEWPDPKLTSWMTWPLSIHGKVQRILTKPEVTH
jgi:hypothetical protein